MVPLEIALDKAESYLVTNKENIPSDVFGFFYEVCKQERQYLEMIKTWSKQQLSPN